VARVAVVALHGVGDHGGEESFEGAIERLEQGGLAGSVEIGEEFAEVGGGAIEFGETGAIESLLAAVGADELAIDEVDDAGPRGAGSLVGGNDLFAEGGEGAAFGGSEKAPRRLRSAAGYESAPSRGRSGEAQELAPPY